jgi:antirestriction protein ArdC
MSTETEAPALAPKSLADYSARNAALIVAQLGEDVTALAGYRTWQRLGRQVRRGEKGAAIRRPVTEADPDDPTRRTMRNVRGGTVFDVGQTDPLEAEVAS